MNGDLIVRIGITLTVIILTLLTLAGLWRFMFGSAPILASVWAAKRFANEIVKLVLILLALALVGAWMAGGG
jgi:uncharacterized membrane protein required for colicin V production